MMTESGAHLFGVVCTYMRDEDAIRYLDQLDEQTLRPSLVIVVDNGASDALRDAVAERSTRGTSCRYLRTAGNIGPAGAFRVGYEALDNVAKAGDLVVHLDDDDPPVCETSLADLVRRLGQLSAIDPCVGGVGLSGGRLNRRTGIVRSANPAEDVAEVDHLHGGYLPVYRYEALAEVGANDPSFWFGFEELELGRRLTGAGWRLFVDVAAMRLLEDRYPKRGKRVAMSPDWSRFHKERNLVRILRRERLWSALLVTVLGRHLAKPLAHMVVDPRTSARRMRIGVLATVAGLRGMGGIDPRFPPPA